ncbi:hypothetical protein [Enterococcus durans]|nr:hypothetical protein [Enterococcus durans]
MSIAPFVTEGEKGASIWMLEEGKRKSKELGTLLEETATSIYIKK